MTIFDQDLRTMYPDQLTGARVDYTVIDGVVAWDRTSAP
jgi:predicted amidohydrolase YtcJ